MKHQLAFLHTSPLHVATFGAIAARLAPHLLVRHDVNEASLAEAGRVGAGDPSLALRVQAAMLDAASTGASVIVCTCSTIGGVVERTPTQGRFIAARIDRTMADRAAALGPRILVVAALQSTLSPTIQLLRESAERIGVEIETCSLWVRDAWPFFVANDPSAYLQTIVRAIAAQADDCDVIVLARASMAPAALALTGLGVAVLSSPEVGVEWAIARVALA